MDNKIQFSVIMPVYNGEKYINNAIDSIIQQDFTSFEIIIVNDCSTDNTVINCEQYLSLDNVTLISLEKNGGVSNARNIGIQNSNGDYICFLDSDDVYLDNHFSELDHLIKDNPDISFIFTGHQDLLIDGTIHKVFANSSNKEIEIVEDFISGILDSKLHIHTNSVCIKRDVFNTIGYFETSAQVGEDNDMWYRCGLLYPALVSNTITTQRNRVENSITSKYTYLYETCFDIRAKKMIEGENLTEDKKKSLLRYLQERTLSNIGHLLLENKKKEAMILIGKSKFDYCSKFKRLKVRMSFFVPNSLLVFIYKRKQRGFYFE